MGDEDETLLAEQVAYYRARAPEYHDGALDLPGVDELLVALDSFAPHGDVVELACGPGTWTPQLLAHATTVTGVDASPEMLELARARVRDDARVRLVHADLFTWRPDRRFDVVFLGFWVSHVPPARVEAFWRLVDDALAPGGRVFLVDDAHRTEDELVEGVDSWRVRRRLRDGTPHRIVKVGWTPEGLERRLAGLGWDIAVHPTAGPFYWGAGARARTGTPRA